MEENHNLSSYSNIQNLSQFLLLSWIFGNIHKDETVRDCVTLTFSGNGKEGKSCVHCQITVKQGCEQEGCKREKSVKSMEFCEANLPFYKHHVAKWTTLNATRTATHFTILTAPKMCAPNILSVDFWLRIFTMPSVSAFVFALLFAANGNFPILYSTPYKTGICYWHWVNDREAQQEWCSQSDSDKNRSNTKLEGDMHRTTCENNRQKEVPEKIA